MAQYRKKPVVIEAMQLLIDNLQDVVGFIDGKPVDNSSSSVQSDKWMQYELMCRERGGIPIKTLESDGETQLASFGDYVIKGIQGEFYPCKPDIFDKTYDKV